MNHPLLFLDIDGVLNAHEHDPEVLCGQIHRDKVQLINHVLRETDARIILSSAWRYIVHRREATIQGMDWLLRSHGMLAGRLIGITRPDKMVPRETKYSGQPAEWPVENERGRQITDWIDWHLSKWVPYAAVDDLDLGITKEGHPLVLTDGTVGLTEANAVKLIGLLKMGRTS